MTDRIRSATGADHHHRRGREHQAQACRVRGPLPLADHTDRLCIGGQFDRDLRRAALELHLGGKPAVPQSVHGRVVPAEDVGHEAGDAVSPGHHRQMLDQQRADALVLPGVGHQQRQFGGIAGQPLVGRNPDDLPADPCGEGLVVGVRGANESLRVFLGGIPADPEEAQIQRPVRCAEVQLVQSLDIRGHRRADVHQTPIGTHRVNSVRTLHRPSMAHRVPPSG